MSKNKIQNLTQAIRDFSEADLDYGTIVTLKKIDDESLLLNKQLDKEREAKKELLAILENIYITQAIPSKYKIHDLIKKYK